MKKVLLIDPWGISNTSEYLNGLIYGLSPLTELTVFTNYYFNLKVDTDARIYKVFFPKTEIMQRSLIRSALRGIEYYTGYQKILSFLKHREDTFDVIHINWLLKYDMDIHFLRKLKKYTKKLVYTAHNAIPHLNGEAYIEKLRPIYDICDRIILHGLCLEEELNTYFHGLQSKVYIQKHGCNLKPSIDYDESKVSSDIKQKIAAFNRISIFFGVVYQNKGPDRLIEIWRQEWKESLLIVAGKRNGAYPEMEAQSEKISNSDNILVLNEYVDDNTLNYLIAHSNIIMLPYRHASMSGVVFTAADFAKPVMFTDTGALKEYLNEYGSFIVDNDDKAISNMIEFINNHVTNEQLGKMGISLQEHILNTCSWKIVAQGLVDNCY